MNIVVVDLEATCSDDGSITREQAEIIEIGAVLVATSPERNVSEFQSFVRPVRNTKLHPFCTKLTSITQEQVDGADIFGAVYRNFSRWLATNGGAEIFTSWGNWDFEQMQHECAASHTSMCVKRLVGLHGIAKRLHGIGSKFRLLRHLGIKWEGRLHRGIDDARMHAAALIQMLKFQREAYGILDIDEAMAAAKKRAKP